MTNPQNNQQAENIRIITEFCRAWDARDIDAIAAALDVDVLYHNIPFEPINGREQVVTAITPLVAGCSAIHWEIHHAAANGDIVLTERTDRFTRADNGYTMSMQVMGIFELKNGRIKAWRDYFDAAQWASQQQQG